MVTITRPSEGTITEAVDARSIPPLTKSEARPLAETEAARVVALLERLEGDDWSQPTDCDEWNVQQMAAHLAGGCAGFASWGQFFRLYIANPYIRVHRGEAAIHGVNRCEVADRADRSPAELIEEMKRVGPRAVNTRQAIPKWIRNIRMNLRPLGNVPISYLLDIIYPRDQWMHRADICRATGRDMYLTEGHDGRILDLVALDLAERLRDQSHAPVLLTLTGPVTRTYRFGTGEPAVHIHIDALEFNRAASLRSTPDEALAVSEIDGDRATAQWFFENCEVGY